MRIFISGYGERAISLVVEPSSRIEDVKLMFQDKVVRTQDKVVGDSIRLMYAGMCLGGDRLLSDYSLIQEGSNLYAVSKLSGGGRTRKGSHLTNSA